MLKIKTPTVLKRTLSIIWLFIGALPVTLPIGVAVFGAIALLFLLNDSLVTAPVMVTGLTAALFAMGMTTWVCQYVQRPGGVSEKRVVDVLVLLLAIFWVGFNISFTSEHVFTDRDPATYAVAGAWLTEHDNLRIQMPEALQEIEGVRLDSAGFSTARDNPNEVYAQGQHLLPLFLGMGGRLFGDAAVFNTNIVIGAIALLAVYGFARFFVRPRWAILAPVVLGVSLPMLYLSRDTYSEPLMMVFVFGGLSALWLAMKQRVIGMWLIAGFMAGAGTLARIDAYLVLAATIATTTLWAVLQPRKKWQEAIVLYLVFLAGAVSVIGIGMLDLYALSPQYLVDLWPLFMQQALLLLATVGASFVTLAGVYVFPKLLPWLHRYTKSWRAQLLVIIVIAVALFMASRPLWMQASGSGLNEVVVDIQEREGDMAAARSYAEQTTRWIEWYLGPLMAGLGVVGMAIVTYLVARKKQFIPLTAVLLVIAGTALVYLMMPNITPDHPWAARRFLPVVLPGLAVFAVFAVDWLSQKYLARNRTRLRPVFSVLVGASLIIAPLSVSWPFLELRDTARLEQVHQVCDSIPDKGAVIWAGDARLELVVPTLIFCDKPAGILSAQFEADVAEREVILPIAQELRERGYTPIVGVYREDMHFLPTRTDDHLESLSHVYQQHQRTLQQAPHRIESIENVILLGEVTDNGTVIPLER